MNSPVQFILIPLLFLIFTVRNVNFITTFTTAKPGSQSQWILTVLGLTKTTDTIIVGQLLAVIAYFALPEAVQKKITLLSVLIAENRWRKKSQAEINSTATYYRWLFLCLRPCSTTVGDRRGFLLDIPSMGSLPYSIC
jgi:hypothetical protein